MVEMVQDGSLLNTVMMGEIRNSEREKKAMDSLNLLMENLTIALTLVQMMLQILKHAMGAKIEIGNSKNAE